MNTFERIDSLLKQQGKKQVQLTNFLGIPKSNYTDWKTQRTKSYTKHLPQIAEFLDVSVDFLVNMSDSPRPLRPEMNLSDQEKQIVLAWRRNPRMQEAVCRLLNIPTEQVEVYIAAHSSDNHPHKILRISAQQWDALISAPQTDDDLI